MNKQMESVWESRWAIFCKYIYGRTRKQGLWQINKSRRNPMEKVRGRHIRHFEIDKWCQTSFRFSKLASSEYQIHHRKGKRCLHPFSRYFDKTKRKQATHGNVPKTNIYRCLLKLGQPHKQKIEDWPDKVSFKKNLEHLFRCRDKITRNIKNKINSSKKKLSSHSIRQRNSKLCCL